MIIRGPMPSLEMRLWQIRSGIRALWKISGDGRQDHDLYRGGMVDASDLEDALNIAEELEKMVRRMRTAAEIAFREGFQAGAPDATWDQEWEDGEWKVSKTREVLE